MASLDRLNKEVMVVTSTYIMHDKLPILYVSNDYNEDDGFVLQFHCDNGDYSMEKMLLVRLDTILSIDFSLSKISLEIGEEARRKTVDSKWIVTKQ